MNALTFRKTEMLSSNRHGLCLQADQVYFNPPHTVMVESLPTDRRIIQQQFIPPNPEPGYYNTH